MSSCAAVWTVPTLLAPMEGVAGNGLRDLLASYGRPGLICAPFLRVTAQPPNVAWLRGQLHRTKDIPLSMQLLGGHPQHLALAAHILADAGADVVDLNLGCPSRQVVNKGAGAGLLPNLGAISNVVGTMRGACHTRLSVKIRAGVDSLGEAVCIAKAIESAGADFLVVHPRTRRQGYSGVADWNVVRRVKLQLAIPVVGNGDLWYAADAMRLMRTSGADAVMIGRAALRNPFIFRQIEELRQGIAPYVPSGVDIVEHVERLAAVLTVELGRTHHGPEGALKEQVQLLLRAVAEPARTPMWQRAMRAGTVADIVEAIRPLRDLPELDLAADGPLRLETTPPDPS
jgi:tRNA-dihydrouridine synthase B